MQALGHVGVLCVEYFVERGKLVANEMAPRVHNSGHWTIEGAGVSQFENHLRAVLGMPLGDTAERGTAAMLNWVGELPPRDPVLAEAHAHWHDYGKSPRAGRKVGHATVCAPDSRQVAATAWRTSRKLGMPCRGSGGKYVPA